MKKKNTVRGRTENSARKKTAAPKSTALVAATPLTAEENAFIDQYALTQAAQGPRRSPKFIDKPNSGDVPTLARDPDTDTLLWWAQMTVATGTPHREAAIDLLTQVNEIVGPLRNGTADAVMAMLSHMADIGPRDGLEGMLAAQMVAVHKSAMSFLAQGRRAEQSMELADFRLRHATRLLRLFALQLDTLNRNRGKAPSEQRVVVEHVHVHEGGQAVVGNLHAAPSAPAENGSK